MLTLIFKPQIALCTSNFIHALEPLERVPDERQRHISRLLVIERLDLGTNYCRVVSLIDIVDWEIGHVGGGVEAWLEGSADGAETVPINTVEEGVRFDFDAAT